MNGDNELLEPTTMSIPTIKIMMIIGASHQAFLFLRNCQNSPTIDEFLPILEVCSTRFINFIEDRF